MPARNQRSGGDGGPSYANRASMDARNRTRKFLQEHFTITTKPVSETGWQLGTHHLKI